MLLGYEFGKLSHLFIFFFSHFVKAILYFKSFVGELWNILGIAFRIQEVNCWVIWSFLFLDWYFCKGIAFEEWTRWPLMFGGMHVVNFVPTSWTSKLIRLLVLLVLHYNFFFCVALVIGLCLVFHGELWSTLRIVFRVEFFGIFCNTCNASLQPWSYGCITLWRFTKTFIEPHKIQFFFFYNSNKCINFVR
jgi:hypothetical protein